MNMKSEGSVTLVENVGTFFMVVFGNVWECFGKGKTKNVWNAIFSNDQPLDETNLNIKLYLPPCRILYRFIGIGEILNIYICRFTDVNHLAVTMLLCYHKMRTISNNTKKKK